MVLAIFSNVSANQSKKKKLSAKYCDYKQKEAAFYRNAINIVMLENEITLEKLEKLENEFGMKLDNKLRPTLENHIDDSISMILDYFRAHVYDDYEECVYLHYFE